MIKKDNYKMRKLWLAMVLSLSLTTNSAVADASTIEAEPIIDSNNAGIEDESEVKELSLEEAKAVLDEAAKALDKATEALKEANKAQEEAQVTVNTSKDAIESADKAVNDEIDKIIADAESEVKDTLADEEEAKKALADAEAKKQEAQAAYDKAVAEQIAAQEAYNKILSENPNVEFEVTDAEKAVEDAQAKVDEAEKNKAKAEEAYNTAAAEEAASKVTLENAQAALAESEKALADANSNVTSAKTNLANAKAELAKYTEGSEEYTEALVKVEAAEKALADAEAEITVAQGIVIEKEVSVKDAETEYNNAVANETEYKSLLAEADKALSDANTAKEALEKVATEKGDAEQSVTDAEIALKDAQTALTNAEANTVIAKTELEAANKVLEDTKVEYAETKAAAEKAVADAQAIYDDAGMNFIISNCLQYKDSNGNKVDSYTVWKNVMSGNATLAQYMDDKFDEIMKYQFNADNMKKYMEFIDESNELRAQEGVDPLYVDYDLMLFSALSNAISSQVGYSGGHLLFNTCIQDSTMRQFLLNASGGRAAENLAFGYVDPYKGWYDKEKALYDAGERDQSKVGHYLSIKNANYNITGFAMSGNKTSEQSFGYYADASLTTDQFIAKLDAYTKSAKDALDKAKAYLATLTDKAVKDAEADVTAKEKAYNDAVDKENTEKEAVTTAQDKVATAKAEAETANESYEKALNEYNTKKTEYDKAKEAAENFAMKNDIDTAKAYDALEKARLNLAEAEANLSFVVDVKNSKFKELEKARANLASIDGKFNELTKLLIETEQALLIAQNNKVELQKDYERKTNIVAKAVAENTDCKNKLNNAQIQYGSAKDEHNVAGERLDEVKEKRDSIIEKYSGVASAKKTLDETITKVTDAEIELEKAKTNVETALGKYSEAKKIAIEVKTELEEAKAIDRNDPDSYAEYLSVKELEDILKIAKEKLEISEQVLFDAKERAAIAQAIYDKADKEYAYALANYTVLQNAENENGATGNVEITKPVKETTVLKTVEESPQTSDDSNLIPSLLGMMGALALAGVAIRKKDEKQN